MFSDYDKFDGLGLAELVRKGEVSSLDLMDEAIARIEKTDDVINAVVHKCYDLARRSARTRKELGGNRPFEGVPFLLKDLGAFCEGVPTSFGSKYFHGFVSPLDDHLVRRYKESGVSILGKTHAPELGLICTTESQLFGATRNPWDVGRSAGGSSGGAAAAVAAGYVPITHANDGGGSIRIPASCCGLVGMKPSRARISYGPVSGGFLGGLACDHVVSRTVRDSAAMLDATAGSIPGDPYVVPPPAGTFLDATKRDPERLRIAFCATTFEGNRLDPTVERATRSTATHLESLGHHVEEIETDPFLDDLIDAFLTIWAVGASNTLDAMRAWTKRDLRDTDVEPMTWWLYERGRRTTAGQFSLAWNRLFEAGYAMANTMENYDVLMTPTLSRLPMPLGSLDIATSNPEPTFMAQIEYSPFTLVFNATGQPSISLPLHQSDSGLPIGILFNAELGEEELLFSLAGQLEKSLPWRERRPQLDFSR